MRVLIADDDSVLRHALRMNLERWSYEVVECADGSAARRAMQDGSPPLLAIINWNMPGVDGPALCHALRKIPTLKGMYIILLTSNASRADVIAGLESGVDDYITKPFDWDELRARLRIGNRVVRLQQALNARVGQLELAVANLRTLRGLLPICAYCKRIRDDEDYWQQIEHYLAEHSGARFSHGVCPECMAARAREDV